MLPVGSSESLGGVYQRVGTGGVGPARSDDEWYGYDDNEDDACEEWPSDSEGNAWPPSARYPGWDYAVAHPWPPQPPAAHRRIAPDASPPVYYITGPGWERPSPRRPPPLAPGARRRGEPVWPPERSASRASWTGPDRADESADRSRLRQLDRGTGAGLGPVPRSADRLSDRSGPGSVDWSFDRTGPGPPGERELHRAESGSGGDRNRAEPADRELDRWWNKYHKYMRSRGGGLGGAS